MPAAPNAIATRGAIKGIGELPGLTFALFSHTNSRDIPRTCPVAGAADPLFLEQNDPYRMTSLDYARDTQATGLDQLVQIALWARQGAKFVDFPYVQPVYAPSLRSIAMPTPTARIEDVAGDAPLPEKPWRWIRRYRLGDSRPGTQALRLIGAPPHLRLRLNGLKTLPAGV